CLYRRPSTTLAALRLLDIVHYACVAAPCQRRGLLADSGKDLRAAALVPGVALAFLLSCEPAVLPPSANFEAPVPLPSSTHRSLQPDECHRFEVDLAAGVLLDVAVTQEGVDLSLRVLGPGDRELLTVDGPYAERGTERGLIEIEASGPHTVELTASAGSSAGSYTLRATHRGATAADRPFLEASSAQAAGDRARRSKDWELADQSYNRAAELWRRAGDRAGESLALHRLGMVRRRQGDRDAALVAYLDAARVARAAGLRVPTADLVYGVGRLRLDVANLEGAVDAFREAATLYAEQGDRQRQALAVNQVAGALERRGHLDAARRAYGQALELARQQDDPRWQGTFLNNLGEVHLRLGQPELALDLFDEALALRWRAGDRRGEGITLTSRGTAERRLDRLDEARDSFVAAWQLLRAEGDRPMSANALVGLGLTELKPPQAHRPELTPARLERAERAFTSALELLRGPGRWRSVAMVLLDLAEVHLARSDGDRARTLADEALALFDVVADRQGQASSYFAIARAERLRGRLEVAHRFHTLALERMESMRERARVDPLRTSYLAFRREYYEHAVDVAMELHRRDPGAGWLARALETSERSRARSLLETLLFARADLPRRLDPLLRDREDRAEARLIDLEVERVRLDLTGAEIAALDAVARRLRHAALELAEIREALRTADPATADLLRPEPFDVDRFSKAHLDPGTVLIEISLGETRSHLFRLDRDGVAGYPLPRRYRLERLARLAHEGLQHSRKPLAAGRARRALRELSRELLGPVADRLGDRRLVVVAEGALQYVPFAVLPDPRRLDEDEPPPLLERHEVVSLPSASVLEALRRPRPSPPVATRTLAVLADPVFGPDDPRLRSITDSAAPQSDALEPLERLPFTADEAAAIVALMPEDEGLAALGFDAHVDLVTSGALADYRILHFATHGRLHAEQPELSGLEFSRYDDAGRPRRGTLYAHQIYDLPLGANLVVLSACRTALGREVRGEGLVGLTRGFFHAGASRVVVSLWSVDDRATTELMIRFYRHLLTGGLPPAAALRAAQRELRAESRWSAPYYWAGFILQGDWR
ncbi:MAG: CHAT domain-containing protein, partial [bacterium]|nr:CHAT domain-containing protein [bacterium]